MNDMNIACFIALATSKNLVSAMTMMNISKGAVLQNIRHLENELGIDLFFSTSPIVKLTEAGEKFYQFFKSFEDDMIRTSVSLETQTENHIIRLAFSAYIGCPSWILEALHRFGTEHPDLELIVLEDAPELCTRLLLEGKTDLLITSRHSLSGCNVRTRPLGEQTLYLWAKEGLDVSNVALCCCPEEKRTADANLNLLKDDLGLCLMPKECANMDTLHLTLVRGGGVVVSPKTRQLEGIQGLISIPLHGTVSLCLAAPHIPYRKDAELLCQYIEIWGRQHEL